MIYNELNFTFFNLFISFPKIKKWFDKWHIFVTYFVAYSLIFRQEDRITYFSIDF